MEWRCFNVSECNEIGRETGKIDEYNQDMNRRDDAACSTSKGIEVKMR